MLSICFKGIVQGVGFRPFVAKLALDLHLNGCVYNAGADAILELNLDSSFLESSNEFKPLKIIRFYEVAGSIYLSTKLELFFNEFFNRLPKAAHIKKIIFNKSFKALDSGFSILESKNKAINLDSSFMPDLATCKDCLNDINNANDRHFNYFFTSCTNCGPRFSVIKSLPYDRKTTSMNEFTLCSDCLSEYKNLDSRFYHAESISCPHCSIPLKLYKNKAFLQSNLAALKETANLLKNGEVVCIKGLCGFAYIANAFSESAITRIKNLKKRESKPLAVMVKDLDSAFNYAYLNEDEIKSLTSSSAPIVLLESKNILKVAKDLNIIGLMLPNTPLLHLLFKEINFPLIYTSANKKGESIATNLDSAFSLNEFVLDNERKIEHGLDDSIVRFIANKIRKVRIARGFSPLNLNLKSKHKILALGAQDKVSFALSDEFGTIISPYIGDLTSLNTQEKMTNLINFFMKTYDFKPNVIVCDCHPNYETTTIAKNLSLSYNAKLVKVYHHHAHLNSLLAESNIKGKKIDSLLTFVFDGSGYGEDGSIWGGEVLYGSKNEFKRIKHLKTFKLIGNEVAIKDIKRIAYSLSLESNNEELIKYFEERLDSNIKFIAKKGINSIKTSSIGRLFDGVGVILGLLESSEYEGQSGLIIESLYDKNEKGVYSFCIQKDEFNLDSALYEMFKERNEAKKAATKFINTLALIALNIATEFFSSNENLERIAGFCGGVFQNKALCERIEEIFKEANIETIFNEILPSNDASISLGQIYHSL